MLSVVKHSCTAIALSAMLTASVYGQASAGISTYIPFEFAVGKSVLPAGAYKFVVRQGERNLSITDPKGSVTRAMVLTRLGGGSSFRGSSLVFDDADGRKVLSEVWVPGGDGLLLAATSKEHAHVTIMATTASGGGTSGKALFERTCARCHGPEGKGNPAADGFFQKPLPRLNSEYVQSKTDAELKEIVTQGRRKMEPVATEAPSILHLLPPESVDAVITYVRTLKKG